MDEGRVARCPVNDKSDAIGAADQRQPGRRRMGAALRATGNVDVAGRFDDGLLPSGKFGRKGLGIDEA